MQTPFLNRFATAKQLAFNTEMSSLLMLVGQTYYDIKQIWTSQKFARQLKVRLAAIINFHKSSTILLNFRTYLYQTAHSVLLFAIFPCSLDAFLQIRALLCKWRAYEKITLLFRLARHDARNGFFSSHRALVNSCSSCQSCSCSALGAHLCKQLTFQ